MNNKDFIGSNVVIACGNKELVIVNYFENIK